MSNSPRLEMRGVRLSLGAMKALRGVELTGEPGKVLALGGENGGGKDCFSAGHPLSLAA